MTVPNIDLSVDLRFFPGDLKRSGEKLKDASVAAFKALTAGTCRGADFTGWYDYPRKQGFAELKEIQSYVRDRKGSYDLVLVIGIGGSYLGTRAVADALTHSFHAQLPAAHRRQSYVPIVYMGHTVSESQFAEVLDILPHHRPIVNVISKSGTTTEPAVAFRVIRKYLESRFGPKEAAERIVCTTDPKSGALRSLAGELGYKSFVIPPNVGGRFSVMTAVGMLPLCLAGYDVEGLVNGADRLFRTMDDAKNLMDHPVMTYARARQAAYGAGKSIELLAHNDPKLVALGEWWKQLFGESEGKEGKGLFPSQLTFTTDLHSMGQYVQEGQRNLLETFLTFDDRRTSGTSALLTPRMSNNLDELAYLEDQPVDAINDAAFLGTQIAHMDGGVPVLGIRCPKLDAYNLGALMAFFETSCAVSALMMGVNPFDQPGVESYKKNLFALMGRKGYEDLAQTLRRRMENGG